ncbi:MAG: hypothetical protein B6D41_00775 [Chloroflexi bacterium UTCFX4]|jgi:serine/threonine protein kinase|nr:MAG: hypothetical protein B6D41_00775 [Chloroflexi bacterium UTCFX4]
MDSPLLQRKLEVAFEDGARLYQQLISWRGELVGEVYRILDLIEIGGQGILYRVEHELYPNQSLLLKIPLREYHRSAYLTPQIIQHSRRMLEWETFVLEKFAGTILPEYFDFFQASSPLHDSWWNNSVDPEDPFLVMEFIEGNTLDDWIGLWHRDDSTKPEQVEQWVRWIARELLDFFEQLAHDGFLYTDLRPANIMLANENNSRKNPQWRRRRWMDKSSRLAPVYTRSPIRLIDAGSIVHQAARADQHVPIQLAYAPPEFYRALEQGQPMPALTPDYVLYTLGKTLWQTLAAQEPVAGQDPEFSNALARKFSSELIHGVHALIRERYTDFENARKGNLIFAA